MRKRQEDHLEATPFHSAEEILEAYDSGIREFRFAKLDDADFSGEILIGASFYGSSMRAANFTGAQLTHAQLKGADLTGANLNGAQVNATDLIGANFTKATFRNADLTGAALCGANCYQADFSEAWLNNCNMSEALFKGSRLIRSKLSSVQFVDVDVSAFCSAKSLQHVSPSSIDSKTVMRSHHHPSLKQFMVDCGVPEIFSLYMIDCAEALEEPVLRMIMQSTFISYGGPDEAFAHKLNKALKAYQVVTFFFPETALVGERIDAEIFRRIKEHDRVLLICSVDSLERPGVVHEIRETLDREARDGGATYLLPITLDDYVFNGWKEKNPDLSERLSRRIIGDFRRAKRSRAAFDTGLARILEALKKK